MEEHQFKIKTLVKIPNEHHFTKTRSNLDLDTPLKITLLDLYFVLPIFLVFFRPFISWVKGCIASFLVLL